MRDGPRAALLDVDGTLVDSNDAHARAWVETFAEAGFEVGFERVRGLIGMGGDKLVPEVTGLDDPGLASALGERRTEVFLARHVDGIRPFPRVRELVQRMTDAGLVVVVATSAGAEEFARLIEIAGVRDLLDHQTTKDDAKASKPDPDIIGAALRKAGAAPADALMLGDTPYDVTAARRAGVATVALLSGGWTADALGDAIARYADAAALLDGWASSPFARLAAGTFDSPSEHTGTR